MTRIETERLILRTPEADDLDEVVRVFSDDGAMQYSFGKRDRAESTVWLEQTREISVEGMGAFGVFERGGEEMVGVCILKDQEVDGDFLPEIGYRIKTDHQGKGYATEAARALRVHAFETIGLDFVVSLIVSENEPSQRVAVKNGMTRVRRGTFKGLELDVWSVDRP